MGSEACEAALAETDVRPRDFTDRPFTGLVSVEDEGSPAGEALARCVERYLEFAHEAARHELESLVVGSQGASTSRPLNAIPSGSRPAPSTSMTSRVPGSMATTASA